MRGSDLRRGVKKIHRVGFSPPPCAKRPAKTGQLRKYLVLPALGIQPCRHVAQAPFAPGPRRVHSLCCASISSTCSSSVSTLGV